MSMDGSPIIDKTHIHGVYLNCGWCYGGFKATPISGWTFAHTIAQDQVHELNSKFSLNRFNTGHLLDEKGVGAKLLPSSSAITQSSKYRKPKPPYSSGMAVAVKPISAT